MSFCRYKSEFRYPIYDLNQKLDVQFVRLDIILIQKTSSLVGARKLDVRTKVVCVSL